MQFLSGIKGTLMGKQKPSLGPELLIYVLSALLLGIGRINLNELLANVLRGLIMHRTCARQYPQICQRIQT